MPPPSEPTTHDATVAYYEEHAERFVGETAGLDMRSLYEPFLALIPKGGRVLDAGCGSGRDAKAFFEMGYEVFAFDASPAMARAASTLTGKAVSVLRFQDVCFVDEFDGIWACASLLHVPRAELAGAFEKLFRAMKPSGVLYASFKLGECERAEGGRLFTDFSPRLFEGFISGIPAVKLEALWETTDRRPARAEVRWVNVLLRKGSGSGRGYPEQS
jgi:SAM-dependent methyltransferase